MKDMHHLFLAVCLLLAGCGVLHYSSAPGTNSAEAEEPTGLLPLEERVSNAFQITE